MPKVIFSISYPICEEKREEYLETIQELKNYLTNERSKNYSVFESKTRPNTFNSDEITEQLINRIVDEFIKDGKTEYKTLIEAV
jgi:flagellar motor component MotA